MFKIKSKWRPILLFCIFCLTGFLLLQTREIWQALYTETVDQVGDSGYNRNLSYYYFLFEANKNIFTAIFGNGFLSAHTSSLMARLMDEGIYNSDVGFIGYYNQFGIIPVIIFISLSIKGIRRKYLPLYVRLYAFYILVGSLTIMYFGQDIKIICFIVYYYLFVYYSHRQSVSPANLST